MRGARAALAWLVGMAVGAAFLWVALRAVDPSAVRALLRNARVPDLLAVVGCALGFVGVKALRWRRLAYALRPLSLRMLAGAVVAGSAVNFVVPHAGELVRAWMVASRASLPKASLLATIAVERLFDFCAVLLLGLAAALAAREALGSLGSYFWVLLGFIVVLLAAVLPFVLSADLGRRGVRACLVVLPERIRRWLLQQVDHGIAGLAALQSGYEILRVLMLSLVQWALMAGCAWFSLHAVGTPGTPSAAIVIMLLLVVGLTLPAAPGHVGTTQVAFLIGAAPFGIGVDEALAASLVYNVFLPVPVLLLGAAVLLHWASRRQATATRIPE